MKFDIRALLAFPNFKCVPNTNIDSKFGNRRHKEIRGAPFILTWLTWWHLMDKWPVPVSTIRFDSFRHALTL